MATKKKTPATKKKPTPAKKVAAKKKAAPAVPAGNGVTVASGKINIRMYNVGFGDCFLVTLPGDSGPKRILVDCGSVAADTHAINDVVAQVIADCTSGGKASIDVVIATHRHKDHVSGFANAAWKNVEVGEVWMPWTEDPDDPAAKQIRETQSKLALALRARFAQFRANPAMSPLDSVRVAQLDGLMLNALSNEAAMDTLHAGFKGAKTRRFMPQKNDPLSFTTGVLPGVTIFVLGPSRDPNVIRDMDPPAGKSYLQIADGLLSGELPEPFRPAWRLTEAAWPKQFAAGKAPTLAVHDKKHLQQLGSDMELAVASSLDKAVNGTSLMLVIKIGSTHLLFPGDAQWGTWQAALQDADKRALMEKAVFYKIGHHGSHNATPKEYVDQVMGAHMLAMVSTRPGTYNNVPRGPLLDAIVNHHAHMARTDDLRDAAAPFHVSGDFYADLEIPIS